MRRLILTIFLLIILPMWSFAASESSDLNALYLIEKILSPNDNNRPALYKQLDSTVGSMNSKTLIEALRILTRSNKPWNRRNDIRLVIFRYLNHWMQWTPLSPEDRFEIADLLTRIIRRISLRDNSIGAGLAISWKGREQMWQPAEYPLLIRYIQENGSEFVGTDILAIFEKMSTQERLDLKAALFKWSPYRRDTEAATMVLLQMADKEIIVHLLGLLSENYSTHMRLLPRLYWPAIAYVPAFADTLNRPDIEKHLREYLTEQPTQQMTAVTEQVLDFLHQKIRVGDAFYVSAVKAAQKAGPRASWIHPQIFAEFFSRLRLGGFTIDGHHRKNGFDRVDVLNVDFVRRKRIYCENYLR